MTDAGLVLAAGAGRRYGGSKASVVVDGERLVDRSVRLLREGGCDPVVVVLGAWVGAVDGAVVVVNEDWATGMGGSLGVGLTSLGDGVDRVLITLVDHIGLTREAVRRVLASNARLAAAAYEGERRNPALIGHEHWSGVAESAVGDRGARAYLDAHASDVELVEVGDVATADDLDVRPLGRRHHLVLDTRDPRELAAFWSALLGEPVTYDSDDFVVVSVDDRSTGMAFQLAPDHRAPTWPDAAVPQQMHLDVMVDDLERADARVLELGARLLSRGDHVYADPAGHPFCLITRPGWAPPVDPT